MKSFLVSFILIISFVSVAKWLLSEGEMRKITAFFCTLVLVFSLFFNKNGTKLPSFNLKSADYDIKNASFSQENEIIKVSSVPVISAILYDNGINYSKIELKTDKLLNGSIVISKVIVYAPSGDAEKIKEVILKNTVIKSVEVISD